MGIKTVIIPKGNEKDLAELPAVVKKDIKFIPVSHILEVFEVAFGGKIKSEKPKTKRKTTSRLPVIPSETEQPVVRS